ncbi:class I SAM-dependent methyltransferase [Cellulophaga sp. F20128]|uniref:THUMP-like domain-containing protein n=1 Tax=Cellulophaga sp. F20128 TaxID=2926413 RepID=UPI001FF1CC0F|nr:class I SAM-dependent methyltransferase [Cellulophaga sp. F20128]MCK0156892.1 class I SAM-dependent methyltransferase [Cellulophaga sp. F20128]
MNNNILNTGVQQFINENLNTDILSLLLKKSVFASVLSKELVAQIEAKKKCRDKLPTWFQTKNIYYPNKLNIEQTSSEQTAIYKASIPTKNTLLDLTGGFGVDSYFFSKKMTAVVHCEIDDNLSKIAAHNFKILGANNIKTTPENGIDYLRKTELFFDWIYIDPSRRNDAKGKVFFLEDCLPNVPENLELIFNKSNAAFIKTSPLLDFSVGIKSLQYVKEIHVVAVRNEVKELLWILEKNYKNSIQIKTINLTKTETVHFNYTLENEKELLITYNEPQLYVYEPNAAILKSGAFKSVAKRYGLHKLHEHSHLYTSNALLEFPGRRFLVKQTLSYSKKGLQGLKLHKANITTRNFPESVASIRKKHKIKDGGSNYLFFTTDCNNQKIVICCEKL